MTAPFRRVLVPYDGSEPADLALAYGIAFARVGADLDLVNVVDETAAITQATGDVAAFDATPLIEALDAEGRGFLDAAQARCREAGIEAAGWLVHEMPVAGIVSTAEKNGDELIVLGTHARSGLPRVFLGSTTEGVLAAGTTPILAVRNEMPLPNKDAFFSKVLVAVDDSDPADAAVAIAAKLSRTLRTNCVLCSVFDAANDEALAQAQHVVERARARGGFAEGRTIGTTVPGDPVDGIIEEASRIGADAIVIGSHGRRGLERLMLGSVAEHVVRRSLVPVLVVRST